jgi:hypothetical protein
MPDWNMPNERRRTLERRTLLDRRSGIPRDQSAPDRRWSVERRSGQERRLSILSAEDQIRDALRLMTHIVEAGHAIEEDRRTLEGAMVRLRFALDRLEES